eukprot:9461681-Alexandrium_andersonii.AAC.1
MGDGRGAARPKASSSVRTPARRAPIRAPRKGNASRRGVGWDGAPDVLQHKARHPIQPSISGATAERFAGCSG